MPTYSYRCTSCDHAFDIQQAFSDESLTACPECGKPLRKVFNAIGVSFQGSGFYRTDSRAEAKKVNATSSESAKPAAAKKESSTTPAKPSESKPTSTPAKS
jgi:putative FmdB family regulatory protein